MKRARIEDIAREAGVSKATVDRVIHGRMDVRGETARKVAEAAHRIGYYGSGLIDRKLAITVPRVRFGFVLIKEKQEFYQNFKFEIETAIAARTDIRGSATVRFAPSQSPADMAEIMRSLESEVDVIACTAVNHELVAEATADLQNKGKPVFALLNDFSLGQRAGYLGLDNRKAGRIAAWMIATAVRKPGKIALFLGSSRWHGHEQREAGFRAYMSEHAPQFTLLDTIVNLETRQLTYETTLSLLDRHSDIVGICVAGGGMEGAISALQETRSPGDVALVVNELTSVSRDALSQGYATMVIGTPLALLCRDAVRLMADAVDGRSPTRQVLLEPQIFLPPSI